MTLVKEVTYGIGAFGYTLLSFSVISWSMYYYVPPPSQGLVPRVPVYLFGMAMVLGRIVGALSDPVVGYWSDRVSTKWGKRLPFVVFGSLPLVALYVLLWNPPVNGESILNFAFLALVLVSFFFMYTFVVCPYLALLPTMARTPTERVRLSAWLSVGVMTGGGLVGITSSFVIGLMGFRLMGLLWGFAALTCLYVSVWVLRRAERTPPGDLPQEPSCPSDPRPESPGARDPHLCDPRSEHSRPFVPSFFLARVEEVFTAVRRDRPLLIYLKTMTLAWVGVNVLLVSLPYLLSVYLGIEKEYISVYAGATAVTAALTLPWLNWIISRVGQKETFAGAMLFAAVLMVSFLLLGRGDSPVSNLARAFIFFALAGVPLAPLYVLPNSLLAEIIDNRKKELDEHVEAFYFGLQGFVLEFALGLSFGLTTLFFGSLGYGEDGSMGVAAVPLLTGLCFGGAYAFFRRFPLGGRAPQHPGQGGGGGIGSGGVCKGSELPSRQAPLSTRPQRRSNVSVPPAQDQRKGFVAWVERRFSRGFERARPEVKRWTPAGIPALRKSRRPLRDGDHVLVIGGGIAGSAFARQLLRYTYMLGKDVKVTLINATSCNYCGGLMTDLSFRMLEEFFEYEFPKELILGDIVECVYINPSGEAPVEVGQRLITMLRTDKFGYPGFDDYFRERILEGIENGRLSSRLQVIEKGTVTSVKLPKTPSEKVRISYHRYEPGVGFVRSDLEGDILVVASGLRSLRGRVMQELADQTGYVPPKLMAASVTEVDSSGAELDRMLGRMLIVDDVVPNCVAAIIYKRENWVTVTSLNKRLDKDDLTRIFEHPGVKEYIVLPDVASRLRCHAICQATVYTTEAREFFGDRWLVLGDLTGYGRVLKDGYYSAFLGAHLAAWTMAYVGVAHEDMERHYLPPLKRFEVDNRIGMALFYLNRWLALTGWFPKVLIGAARSERRMGRYGSAVHAGIRALATGELTYKMILCLFVCGILRYALRHPVELLRLLVGSLTRRREKLTGPLLHMARGKAGARPGALWRR